LSLDMMQKDFMDRFSLHLGRRRRGVASRKEVFAGLLRTQVQDSRR
jgi:hypothetical protein